jgi:protein ImuB
LYPQPQLVEAVSVVPEGPPLKFHLRAEEHTVARRWGPERIETGWWRDGCIRRDYYRVETTVGERFWLFRELHSGRWFVHGEFN